MLEPLFTTTEPARPARTATRSEARKPRASRPASNTFEFVSFDPSGKSAPESRKFIRSYVMRGKNRKCPNDQRLKLSWINKGSANSNERGYLVKEARAIAPAGCEAESSSHDETESTSCEENGVVGVSFLPGPLRPPSDLSLFNFADPLDGPGKMLIFRFLTTIKQSLYPIEWCFEFDHTSVCWFRWLLEDKMYLHSVLFMVSAFQDLSRHKRAKGRKDDAVKFSPQTQECLRRTIQLLREKIQHADTQIEDTTTAVVMTLAMTADAAGDKQASEAHVAGLKKMIKMRGGLPGFQDNRQMQIKICRVDLGWSVQAGTKPDFYQGKISWEPFLATAIPKDNPYHDQPIFPDIQIVLETWDYKLRNVFLDLHDFSGMANVLMYVPQKLQPELFQEIMVSIQYRLLYLEYSVDHWALEEAVRLGLLAFETTVFLQIPGTKLNAGENFSGRLEHAIAKITVTSPAVADIKLWLLIVGSIIVFADDEPWLVASIRELTTGQDWQDVRTRVKKVMWIDAVHDKPGKAAFEATQQVEEIWTPEAPYHSYIHTQAAFLQATGIISGGGDSEPWRLLDRPLEHVHPVT
ncbi:hypothetical protein G7046_g1892 [Stylonectria norvegica]|nr:hypothetical protein G7046_g1892 [Stylonectria norvegica]